MNVWFIARLAAMVGMVMAVAGCVDAKVDIALTSATTATATMTQVMEPKFYAMVEPPSANIDHQSGDSEPIDADHFCARGRLIENADGSATCIIHQEGLFATLKLGCDDQMILFTSVGPDLVRVALPIASMARQVGANASDDEDARQMNEAFFSGHTVTVRFSGLEVVDTNMSLSSDNTFAEQTVQFLDLINKTGNLPPELFAVVRVK